MLGSQKLVAFVATRDPVQAKKFYRDSLGLQLVSEDEFALAGVRRGRDNASSYLRA